MAPVKKAAKPRKKKCRVDIPIKTRLQLWAVAAGRCEFRGCNKPLYLDELTKTRDNLCIISHIVAAEPGGPRGDATNSPKLAKDISNLMLTCRAHGKIIDSKENVANYPVELLKEYKINHEERVRILTDIQDNARSHVLIYNVPINGQSFNIDESQVHQALLPHYPAKEHPDVIDFSDLADKESEKGYWELVSRNTLKRFNSIFKDGTDRRDYKHVSIFALAPMPLLAYLGNLVGNIDSVELYQRHRSTKDWKWKDETEDFRKEYYEINEPEKFNNKYETAILISISGAIDYGYVHKFLGKKCNIFEIKASKPGLDFLGSKLKLEMFCYEYRQLLTKIREVNGHTKVIHLFCAAPAPVVIECGRSLLPKSDPPVIVYDFNKKDGFVPALTIN